MICFEVLTVARNWSEIGQKADGNRNWSENTKWLIKSQGKKSTESCSQPGRQSICVFLAKSSEFRTAKSYCGCDYGESPIWSLRQGGDLNLPNMSNQLYEVINWRSSKRAVPIKMQTDSVCIRCQIDSGVLSNRHRLYPAVVCEGISGRDLLFVIRNTGYRLRRSAAEGCRRSLHIGR